MPRCYHPWQSLMISADGNVQPCAYRGSYTNIEACKPFGNINHQPLSEIWNSVEAQTVRAAMAKGDLYAAGCSNCLAISQGQTLGLEYDSRALDPQYRETPYARNICLKQGEIERAATNLESQPTVLNYTPSHRCNLRCIHCYQNISRHATILRKEADNEVVELLPFLSDIVAGGGEPLILPLWRKVLKSYDLSVNPFLRFCTTTNAMVLHKDITEQLDKFDRLQIIVSLDGPNQEIFERIRVNSDWTKFERNARVLHKIVDQKTNGSLFGFNIAVMKSNIESLPDFIRYCTQEVSGFNFQPVVTYPLKESLRCFNNPKQETRLWNEVLRRSERLLDEVFFPAMHDSLNNSMKDLYRGHIRALRDLIPWDVLDRPHYLIRLKMPSMSLLPCQATIDYLSDKHKGSLRLQIAFFELTEAGRPKTETHHWAYLETDRSFEVHLPDGRFLMVVGGDEYPVSEPDPKNLYRLVITKGNAYFEKNYMDVDVPWKFFKGYVRMIRRHLFHYIRSHFKT